jgi:hypothetical protein
VKPRPPLPFEIPFGTVPLGWTRSGWIKRLEYLARVCETHNPDAARRYREWAARLREQKA